VLKSDDLNVPTERERREIEYWRDSPEERPGPLSVPNILNKMGDARLFFDFFQRYQRLFRGRVIEFGAGQGWAACLVKRLAPAAHVIATDISPYAVEAMPEWERLWGVRLDRSYACGSTSTREADGSIDLAFCFASAHHFDQEATLREVARILASDGAALFLYEPTVGRLLYRFQVWRMNRVRPAVQEDAIVPARFSGMAARRGLRAHFEYVEPKGWISKPANIVIRRA
jgi:SAM-dependent methyltransferase